MIRARLLLCCVIALAVLALPGIASAQTPTGAPPSLTDEFSAADQYVESVPTSRGPKAPGVGKPSKSTDKRSTDDSPPPLSPSVESSLQRQPEETAAELERIATSPDYGAPTKKLQTSDKSSPRIPTAAVSAVGEREQSTLTLLLLALLAITGLAAGTTAYRRYQAKKSDH